MFWFSNCSLCTRRTDRRTDGQKQGLLPPSLRGRKRVPERCQNGNNDARVRFLVFAKQFERYALDVSSFVLESKRFHPKQA